MKTSFFKFRCKCKEDRILPSLLLLKKKKKKKKPKKPKKTYLKPGFYPFLEKIYFKRFEINYPELLTPKAKFVLCSFKGKYIYYAIDDILYILQSNPTEQNNLLNIFYSTILFLYYHLTIVFFDIWIEKISFVEIEKSNHFTKNKNKLSKKVTLIKFNLFYTIRPPAKKIEPLW